MFWVGAGGVFPALVVPDALAGLILTEQEECQGVRESSQSYLDPEILPTSLTNSRRKIFILILLKITFYQLEKT